MTGTITLVLEPATSVTPVARVFVERTGAVAGTPLAIAYTAPVRGGYSVPLTASPTTIMLTAR